MKIKANPCTGDLVKQLSGVERFFKPAIAKFSLAVKAFFPVATFTFNPNIQSFRSMLPPSI